MKKNLILAICFCLVMCVGVATADTLTTYSGTSAGNAGYSKGAVNLTFAPFNSSNSQSGTYNATLNIFDSTMTDVGDFKISMTTGSGNNAYSLSTNQNILNFNRAGGSVVSMVFDGVNLVNSFYIEDLAAKTGSGASNSYTVTANYILNGSTASFTPVSPYSLNGGNNFWAITLADGAYLTSIDVTLNGNPNGYSGTIGIYGGGVTGDPSDVPEPGSLLLLGTGILGLGIAAKRKLTTK